ncbi:MAG: SURF1 family protein [Thalassobaculaceae bacterium]|nr:SURF1 family protein [Thalassobaculaceae bacterium]
MAFRPRLWPTLFTVPAIVMMLGLGFWQLQRLAWKTELIDAFEARVSGEPSDPPATLTHADMDAWRFRHIAATGRFLHDKELQITGKLFKGTGGFHVITPFVTDSGLTVFVNRGWVPEDERRPDTRPASLVPPPATIDGVVRESGMKGYFVPENEPQNDVWFTIRPQAMADHLGLDGPVATGYYVDQLAEQPRPTRLPFGADRTISVRNEHLQYALTWFLLAITLIAVYVLWHRQADREDAAGDKS